jgi:hypothetical protein
MVSRSLLFLLVKRAERGRGLFLTPAGVGGLSLRFTPLSLSLFFSLLALLNFQMRAVSGVQGSCGASRAAAAAASRTRRCSSRGAPPRGADAFIAASMPSTSASSTSSQIGPSSPRSSLPHLRSAKHVSTRNVSIVTHAVKRKNEKHIVCSKTLIATPGKESLVDEACARLVAAVGLSGPQATPATAAAATRLGVIEFSYGRDSYEPNVFHFWERYDSNVSLGRHNTREDIVAFLEDLTKEGCLEGPVGMVLYEWRDGQLGPACAQGGPKGEGGLDDATGGSGMAGGAGLKQTSATLDLVRS